jgi:CheY-like chemotaxis protein
MKIKVLLVDDQNPELHADILDRYNGLTFTICKRGEHAVRLMQEQRFDVVLMDLFLPTMNGLEAVRLIRQFDPLTPMVVLTGHSRDKEAFRKSALAAGANDFVLKPMDYRRLYQRIVELLVETTGQQQGKDEVEIREIKQRRLHLLRAQAALKGTDAPPALIIEIEDLERELEDVV